jgi:TPR repeat protein
LYTLRAAELGMLEGMHNVGVMYLEGVHVDRDSFKALSWWHRACGFGFTHSAFNAAKLFI